MVVASRCLGMSRKHKARGQGLMDSPRRDLSSEHAWCPVRGLRVLAEAGRLPNCKTHLETACRTMPYLGSSSIPVDTAQPPLGSSPGATLGS